MADRTIRQLAVYKNTLMKLERFLADNINDVTGVWNAAYAEFCTITDKYTALMDQYIHSKED